MKVRSLVIESDELTYGKAYDVLSIEDRMYRIIPDDEEDEDYLYPPECFEVMDGSYTTDHDTDEPGFSVRLAPPGGEWEKNPFDWDGFVKGKAYPVISVEKGLYRIKNELRQTFLYDPKYWEPIAGSREE